MATASDITIEDVFSFLSDLPGLPSPSHAGTSLLSRQASVDSVQDMLMDQAARQAIASSIDGTAQFPSSQQPLYGAAPAHAPSASWMGSVGARGPGGDPAPWLSGVSYEPSAAPSAALPGAPSSAVPYPMDQGMDADLDALSRQLGMPSAAPPAASNGQPVPWMGGMSYENSAPPFAALACAPSGAVHHPMGQVMGLDLDALGRQLGMPPGAAPVASNGQPAPWIGGMSYENSAPPFAALSCAPSGALPHPMGQAMTPDLDALGRQLGMPGPSPAAAAAATQAMHAAAMLGISPAHALGQAFGLAPGAPQMPGMYGMAPAAACAGMHGAPLGAGCLPMPYGCGCGLPPAMAHPQQLDGLGGCSGRVAGCGGGEAGAGWCGMPPVGMLGMGGMGADGMGGLPMGVMGAPSSANVGAPGASAFGHLARCGAGPCCGGGAQQPISCALACAMPPEPGTLAAQAAALLTSVAGGATMASPARKKPRVSKTNAAPPAAGGAPSSAGAAPDRRHMCSWPNCGKAFGSKWGLGRHYRIHTGDKPWICTIEGCGKRFVDRTLLQRHENTHSSARPFACTRPGCGKAFKVSKHLE